MTTTIERGGAIIDGGQILARGSKVGDAVTIDFCRPVHAVTSCQELTHFIDGDWDDVLNPAPPNEKGSDD